MNSNVLADNWRQVQAGKTTEAEALKLLGNPLGRDQADDLVVLLYPSGVEDYPNGVGVRDGVVQVVGIQVDPTKQPTSLSATLAKYGSPDKVTFSTWDVGFRTHIYAKRGLMFTGNPETDQIVSAQYFAPMTIERYMETWGKDLPLEDPFVK